MRTAGTVIAMIVLSVVGPAEAGAETSSRGERLAMAAPARTPQGEEQGSRVELRGEWVYVDGEPFLVKGVGYSPYRPGQLPWKDEVNLAIMERDFQRMTEAGFNTIRTWSPLSPPALELAARHGLMVLQGIWISRSGAYNSEAFRAATVETVRRTVEQFSGHDNILAVLVGNELLPQQVYDTGVAETESLLRAAAQAVKERDGSRFVSYANWPSLSFLDASIWDVICLNLYPYEPANVSHSFGFRSYVEHVKRTAARSKPLIISEVGLSVSPVASSKSGYGGWEPQAQSQELLRLWDALFQGRAQGGVVFEWNDEWWKQGEAAGDELAHDEQDPEEWFGLLEFPSRDSPAEGLARPAYDALKAYNQAILISPVGGVRYQGRVPVSVYAVQAVAQIRLRVDADAWVTASHVNRHWWKATLPLKSRVQPGEHWVTMEAYDADHALLLRRQRAILVGPPPPTVTLSIRTDQPAYMASAAMQPVRYTITAADRSGRPLADQPMFLAVLESQALAALTLEKRTDATGRIEGVYLVREPGMVTFSAATPIEDAAADRRVGEEVTVVVHQLPSLDHIPSRWEGRLPPELLPVIRHPEPAFQLADPGQERLVDYERYGTFHDVGTSQYRYEVLDFQGLAAAVGEGIYPNSGGLLHDAAYVAAKAAGALDGSHWEFTFHENPQLAFFKWADTDEEPGVQQFHVGVTLERAGLWLQAVKAYYATLVHYPTSVGWTAFDPPTPWYVGPVARDKILAILRLHPELRMRLEGARVIVQKGFDNDVDNDTILASPGRLVSVSPDAVNPPSVDPTALATTRTVGQGRVRLVQYENGHWQLLVDGRPWVIRGLTYKPSAVGETPDEGTVLDWMTADRNANGTADIFETFADTNRNNQQDAWEPSVGDPELLRAMGVNTLRLYHTDHENLEETKRILRQLYDRSGIMVAMGDFVGMYTVGSGARWEDGTDYLDKTQRARMFESVKRMVMAHKDEPYLLLWVLGNENNYGGVHGIIGGTGNAGKYPKEYYRFINELATWIHSADPDHPVTIGNGDLLFLDIIAKQAPAIDIFGANAYRGWHGVGRTFFEQVQELLDKPVLVTEFGCSAYQQEADRDAAERDQALYLFGTWVDLVDNMAGRGVGNALGGIVFEWSDEWWKAGQPPRFSPTVQETSPHAAYPFPGGWSFEEWYGLMSQGDGGHSPFLRQPRLSYDLFKRLWSSPE